MQKILVCALLIQATLATAQTNFNWSATASTGSMDTAGNWINDAVPTSDNYLRFVGASTSLAITNDLPSSFTFASPSTSNAYSLYLDQNYTMSNGTFIVPTGGGEIFFAPPSTGSVGLIQNSNLTLNGTLTISSPTTTTYGGTLSGSGGLTLYNGTGLVFINSTSTSTGFTGITTINPGANLYPGTTNAFPPNSSINNNGTLNLVSPKNGAFNASIPGFSGASQAGMINLGTATLTIGNGGGTTISGSISGSTSGGSGLTLNSGTLTLSGNNTFQNGGTFTVNTGATLIGNSTNAFGVQSSAAMNFVVNGTVEFSGLTASVPYVASTLSGSGTLNFGTAGIDVTRGTASSAPFSGTLSGSGNLVVSNGGVLTLSSTNNYTGSTVLETGGTLIITTALPGAVTFPASSGGTLQAGANSLTVSGATITACEAAVFSIPVEADTLTVGAITATNDSNIFVQGPGTLLLNASNPINATCPMFIDNGTLTVGTTSLFSMAPPALNLYNGGVLNLNSNSNTIGALNGYGTVELGTTTTLTIENTDANSAYYGTFTGSGTISLESSAYATFMDAANTYSGISFIVPTNATLSTVTLGSSPSLTLSGTIFLGSDTTLPSITIPSSSSGTIYPNTYTIQLGTVSGTGSTLNVYGPGTTILGGTLTSVSALAVQGGTINIGASSLPSTVTIQLGSIGATIQAGAALTLTSTQGITVEAGLNDNFATPITFDANNYGSSIAGLINGGAAPSVFYLTDSSGGTNGKLTLTNTSNSWSGPTSILNGTLNAVPGAIPAKQLVFGGSLQPTAANPIFQCGGSFTGGSIFTPSVVVMSQGGTIDLNTYNMNISGVLAGVQAATLTVKNSGGGTSALTLSNAANIFNGTIIVNNASLIAGSTQAFGTAATINLETSGGLQLGGNSNTIGSLEGRGSGVNLGAGTLTISNGNGYTFSGNIVGSGGGLTLTTGTLTLGGSNSYSGATLVNGGSLIASNGIASPFGTGSNITVATGAALNFGTVAASGISSVGTLTNQGSVTADLSSVSTDGITLTGYTQESGASLTLKLPSSPGGSFLGFNSTGAINLDGTLTVTGLGLSTESQVNLLQGTSISGNFSSSAVPSSYTLNHNSTMVFLSLTTGSAFSWSGDTGMSTNMSVNGNWVGGVAPASGDLLIFLDSNASTYLTAVNNIGTYTLSSTGVALIVDSGFSISGDAFVVPVAGSSLNLAGTTSTASTISNPFTLNGLATITGGSNNVPTLSGILSGTGGPTLFGGNLVISNTMNDYTGSTTILNGTLKAMPGVDGGLGAGLVFGGTGQPASPNPIFQLGSSFPAFASAITMTSSGTIDLDSYSMTASGILSGPAASTLTVTNTSSGTPTLTFTGTENSFSGTIEVDHATLVAGAADAFGTASTNPTISLGTSGSIMLGSYSNTIGSLEGGGLGVNLGTGTLTIYDGSGNTFSGNITDASSGSLLLATGTLTLSGTNTYHGSTTIDSGSTLAAASTSALSDHSLFIVDGTLSLGTNNNTIGGLSGSGAVNLGSATLTLSSGNTFSGSITGTGGLTLASSSTSTQILSGTNSYSGATAINVSNTLQAGSTEALSSNSAYTITGALSLNGNSNTVGSILGSGNISLGSGGILTIANGAGNTFNGSITNSGGGGITLSSGTLTLNGSNTYTGPTTVSSGATLIASNGNTAPFGSNSDITVAGTLEFGTVYANGVSVGSLTNSGVITANLASVTATDGISLTDSLGYTQSGTPSLTLNLATSPGASFVPINAASGPIVLGTGTGSLTITGLAAASGAAHSVTILQGTSQSGSFATTTVPTGYTVKYNPGDGIVYLLGGGGGTVCDATWNYPGSANWDVLADWTSSGGGNCTPGINAPSQKLDAATLPDLNGTSAITILLATADTTTPQNISLYNLDFTAANTSYTIVSYVSSLTPPTYSTITLDGNVSPKPNITVTQGSHAIYAPILLNQNSRLSLSGTLTMGLFSSISDGTQASTLYISEGGEGSGTFISEGPIFPAAVNIEGCTVDTLSSMTPTVSLTVAGQSGNTAPLTLNNYSLILSPTVAVNGSLGTTLVNNIGPGSVFAGFGEIFTSSGPLTFTSATVTNTLGGQIAAATGQTLTITSSQFTNDTVSILGSSTSNISFVSGTVVTSGQVQADNYTQGSEATLQINVANQTTTGLLSINGTGSLGGNLVVNALSGFPSTVLNQAIPIVVDTSAFATQFSNYSLQNFPASVIPDLVFLPDQILLNTTSVVPSHTSASLSSKLVINATSAHNTFITRKCSQMKDRTPFHQTETIAAAGSLRKEELYAQNEEIVTNPIQNQKTAQLARKSGKFEPEPWNVYLGPVAGFGHIKTVGTQIGLGSTSAGGFAGFDTVLPKSATKEIVAGIGAIVEYRKSWGTVLENSGSLSINRIHGSMYGIILSTRLPELYFEWVLGTVYTWETLTRNAGYQNSVHPKGRTNEAVFDALGGVEFTFNNRIIHSFGNFSFTPLLHLQYAYDHIKGYKETGGGIYDLSIPSEVVQSLSTSLGARFDYFFDFPKFTLLLELDAEWQREYFTNNRTLPITAFNISDVATDTTLFGPEGNGLLVALDVFTAFNHGITLEGNGTLQWNSQAYDATFFIDIGKEF